MIKRNEKNPVVTPSMVKPTNPRYRVRGAFNPGAIEFNDEILLLMRVAEDCIAETGCISIPVVKFDGKIGKPDVMTFSSADPHVKLKDTRGVVYKNIDYLSTISHIRIARSKDGVNFKVDDEPFIFPSLPSEFFGVEDARAVKIGDEYFINYTCISQDGWATSLAKTYDFRSIERLGIIFHPENKDVAIFPEKINGKYYALHRPNNSGFGRPSIWIAESHDLIHWGNHKCIARPRDMIWEEMKIGGGAPCIKTPRGWLQIYHGKGRNQVYSLFTLLLDLNDPSQVLARGEEPFLIPEAPYEKEGFFGNVIFTNGIVEKDGKLFIYYGASDEYSCLMETTVDYLLVSCQ
ncbi:MAG: glycoside hydrolase family 130 protein [Bacteroidota bacterium]